MQESSQNISGQQNASSQLNTDCSEKCSRNKNPLCVPRKYLQVLGKVQVDIGFSDLSK